MNNQYGFQNQPSNGFAGRHPVMQGGPVNPPQYGVGPRPVPAAGQWHQPVVPQVHVVAGPGVVPGVGLRGNDGARYVRQQRGHSLIKHLLLGWAVMYIPTIYYAVSKNHYFHM